MSLYHIKEEFWNFLNLGPASFGLMYTLLMGKKKVLEWVQ